MGEPGPRHNPGRNGEGDGSPAELPPGGCCGPKLALMSSVVG